MYGYVLVLFGLLGIVGLAKWSYDGCHEDSEGLLLLAMAIGGLTALTTLYFLLWMIEGGTT